MRTTILTSLVASLALAGALTHCGRAPDADAQKPVAAGAAAASATAEGAKPAAPSKNAITVTRVPIEGLPSMGRDDALVTIVEFTDYQCPYCSRAEKTIASLRAKYGDDVRVVLAAHPLPMHDRADPAARAALAAAEQGKFEAMHARIFDRKALDEASLTAAATELGLDVAKFDADRKGATVSAALDRAMALAKTLGVTGTPSFFINGRRVTGAQPLETFQSVIDEEMSRARVLVASGTPRAHVYAKIMEGASVAPPPADEHDAPGCGGEGHECNGADAPAAADKLVDVAIGDAPIRGFARAPVTVVVFTDFQCPYCARAQSTLSDLEHRYDGNVRIVFKNLPLPMHDSARLAAKAAIAAGNQGKFWEYHDVLFTHQSALDRTSLESYAKTLGLDIARFDADLDAAATEARVAADEAQAKSLDVSGTPTMFVNGRRVVGAQPLATFESVIGKTLNKR